MAEPLKVGDVVRLKSGGHPMVIEKLEGTQALCVWQDSKNEPRSQQYQLTSLQKVEDDPMAALLRIGK
jgi:uncharacterized protein YodC (DUF2158 family)